MLDDEQQQQHYTVRVAVPSQNVLEQVLEQPLHLDEETLRMCERVVTQGLTVDEQETAARASYVYWAWKHLVDDDSSTNDKNGERYRRNMAIIEVRRHYSNRKKTYAMLLKKVKKAMAIRKKERLHLLRVCCNLGNSAPQRNNDNHSFITVPLTHEEYDHCVQVDRLIRSELSLQTNIILCMEQQQTIAALRVPRKQPWVDKVDAEGYPWGALYLAERALAMSEVLQATSNADCRLHIVLDTYQAVHAPRLSAMTNVLQTMQLLYPERLGRALVVHPPLWLRTIVTLLTPFMSPHTAERVTMVTKQKSSSTTEEDRLAAWIRAKGTPAIEEIMHQQMGEDTLYYEPYYVTQE